MVEEAGFVEEHALPEIFFGKIFVPYEGDFFQFEAISASDDVFNRSLVLLLRAVSEIDVYVEIPLALKYPSIARSFNQQVVVHRALLVDRNVTAKNALRHFCFYGSDVDFWPCDRWQERALRGGAPDQTAIFQFDMSSEAIFFLVFPEDALNAPARAGIRDLTPKVD